MRVDLASVRVGSRIPQPCRDVPARLRTRGIPILRVSLAAARRAAARLALLTARCDGQSVELGVAARSTLPTTPRRLSRDLPRRGPDSADSAAPPVRQG